MSWVMSMQCWEIRMRARGLPEISGSGGKPAAQSGVRSSIALSYVRQNQLALADQEYAALAAEAKHKNFSDLEAGFQESMALYQPVDSEA